MGLFFLFFTAFVVCSIILIFSTYRQHTVVVPDNGGIIREGVVGQPRFINPVYAASNDPDRDLVNLLFSGLFKYDINGDIAPDLVESYTLEEGGKTYNLSLKEGVLFHDGSRGGFR